jgi:hypothetical protein
MASLPHKLEDIPNVGPATAADLMILGISQPQQLRGQSAALLYATLCAKTGQRHDPCVEDVLAAAIHYVDSGESFPWWHFSATRKSQCGVKGKRK